MVVELSSDSSSSSASSPVEIPVDILEVLRIRAFYETPLDFIEPLNLLRATRQVTTFDPAMTEASSTSNQGSGPFANSPEEIRGRKRPMRPCPFLGQYFNGTLVAYAEFKRVFSIPLNVEVRLLPNRDPKDLPLRQGELIFPLMVIIEGGIRFPLHQFVQRVLQTLNLTSYQLTVNSYRIIMGIIEQRRQFNLTFGLEELFGVYLVGVNREHDRYYLSCRTGYDTFLIDRLLDFEEWVSIYVSVTGNFMFGPGESMDTATTVPFETGAPAEGIVQELRERAVRVRITTVYAIPQTSRGFFGLVEVEEGAKEEEQGEGQEVARERGRGAGVVIGSPGAESSRAAPVSPRGPPKKRARPNDDQGTRVGEPEMILIHEEEEE
ncbi:hypothetical protein RHMOL_Rhmol05G0159300 [Rhododendron molle]|uniref:Uncharacterized protein n=1 Tax=Rhododendron molle TaxID=49168 RepID=A0ACC0NQH2_RHOML|nr:hypothetical protein RHMOL_Rhmol05G0159300 [Rhododendron molle]